MARIIVLASMVLFGHSNSQESTLSPVRRPIFLEEIIRKQIIVNVYLLIEKDRLQVRVYVVQVTLLNSDTCNPDFRLNQTLRQIGRSQSLPIHTIPISIIQTEIYGPHQSGLSRVACISVGYWL